jgi:phospholipid/cholesterol/gamma-HCH transport system substrate-binding protein
MKGPIANFHRHLATAVASVAAAVLLFLWTLHLGGGLPSFSSTYHLSTLLPDAGQLAPGARVTIAGLQVGKVTSVSRRGLGAIVGVELTDRRVTPIPQDSHVQLRLHTPVGENYLAITPGSSHTAVPSGGALPISQADDYVNVDQILSILQGPSRERARQLIQGMGGALAGRGTQLGAFLDGTSGALTAGSHLIQTAYDDRAQISQLVQQLGDLAGQIGARGSAITQIGNQGLSTMDAIAARDVALQDALNALPATLAQVRTTSTILAGVSPRAAPVLLNLAAAVREVRPAVRLLYPAAQQGRAVMRQLGGAAPALRQTVQGLQALSGPAAAALPQLQAMLCQADPMLRYIRPYAPDFSAWITGMGSMSNNYDAIGHALKSGA